MRLFLALFIWSLSACCLAESIHAFKAVHADGTVSYSDTRPESASSVEEINIQRASPVVEQQGQHRMQELGALSKETEERNATQTQARREYEERLAKARKWVRETEANLATARQSKKSATPEYIGNWEERVKLARDNLREVERTRP